MLMTNSLAARMLRSVSFIAPSRVLQEIAGSGGQLATNMKALNGATLTTPLADLVLTQAIGRGTTRPVWIR